MRGDGEQSGAMAVYGSFVDDSQVESGPVFAAVNYGFLGFGGLTKDYENIIAILLVSVVLALRRRVFRRP